MGIQRAAKRATLVLAVLLMAASLSAPAWAATAASGLPAATGGSTNNPNGAFNVIVTPVSQALEVKPGSSVTETIQLQNQGLATEHIKAYIYTFGANGEDGTPQLIKPTANDDFINWAKLSSSQFDAEPNVWTPVKLTISPPKSAAFGYYYAIIFSRADQAAVGDKQASLQGAVASLVLLDVQAPGAVRKVDIAQFSTAHKSIEFLPESFTVRMHNVGNTHVAPRGNIFIKKGGQTLALLEVNLAKGQILPNSYRLFTASWTDGTPVYRQKVVDGKTVMDPKTNQPESSLVWSNFNLSKLRFGKYTAQLVMVYNDGESDVSDTATLSFWVIPWRVIGIGLVGLVIIAAGLWTLALRPLRRRLAGSRFPRRR